MGKLEILHPTKHLRKVLTLGVGHLSALTSPITVRRKCYGLSAGHRKGDTLRRDLVILDEARLSFSSMLDGILHNGQSMYGGKSYSLDHKTCKYSIKIHNVL